MFGQQVVDRKVNRWVGAVCHSIGWYGISIGLQPEVGCSETVRAVAMEIRGERGVETRTSLQAGVAASKLAVDHRLRWERTVMRSKVA